MSSRIVAIVPARGGSKGIPRKNLALIGGQPMLVWTIRAALDSGVVDRLIVSTDDEEIAEVAREAGAETPFLRPAEIARDDIHAMHVVLHTLDWLREQERVEPEGVMMLLPTSPLRRSADIRDVVGLFDESHADAVISVADLGKYLTNLRYLHDKKLEKVAPHEDPNAQRQGLRKLYGVNGSIFIARPAALRRAGTFHIDGALGYVMNTLTSIDINTIDDLELARTLFDRTMPWSNGSSTS